MQQLCQEIQLFVHSEIESPDQPRVWLNAGACRAQGAAAKTLPYDAAAYIPKLPWRPLTPEESRLLSRRTPPRDWSACIGIVRVPETIVAPLQRLGLGEAATKPDILQVMQHPEYERAMAHMQTYVQSLSQPGTELQPTGLALNPSELPTVTFNPETQTYIGLHLDSWDRLPLARRHRARNRISVNLGREDRSFVFINLTMRTVAACLRYGARAASPAHIRWRGLWRLLSMLQPARARAIPTGATAAGQAFMQRYPDYPVIKVRVAPGEAYIAPTENMIHDASTLSKRDPDLHLTFLGHLGPGLPR